MGALEAQVAIVTGSSSGIGEAIARRFAAEGARVVVNSARSVDAGRAVAASLPDAIYVQADVSDEKQDDALVAAALAQWGRLDILVNNAGTTELIAHTDLDSATLQVFQRIYAVNVFGTWLLSRAAVPALRATKGSIVNITSLAGSRPLGSSIPYASSKAAVDHLSRLLAKALGPDIRVNSVAPGLIDTPWTADWDAAREGVRRMAPLARSGVPDDVADIVLGVTLARYMTGQVVVVDGGLHLT